MQALGLNKRDLRVCCAMEDERGDSNLAQTGRDGVAVYVVGEISLENASNRF